MADFNAGVTPADIAPGVEDTPGSGAVGVQLHNADENMSVYVRLAHTQLPPVATDRGIRVPPGGNLAITSVMRRAFTHGRRAALAGALLTCGGRNDD